MAQENFNVSLPNDGLGDALRDAFIKQQSMNTELYTTKVDKVVGKDLSTNDFTNALKSKLDGIENFADVNVQSDWLQTDDTADDYIKNKPNFSGLVPDGFTLAETTLVDQEFTINAAQWYVNGQLNILPFSFPALSFEIPLASAGLQRFDLFYGTNVGTIERIEGAEATVAVEPTLPPNSVRLTVILTNDTSSVPPPAPDLSGFIQKNSFAYLPLSSIGGAPVAPASLNFITTDGDGVTGFSGFQSGSVFIGQRMIIRNDKTTDFELTPAGLFDFTFDQSYTIKSGDNIEFDFTASGFRQVGSSGVTIHNDLDDRDASNAHPMSAITGLETALDAKLDKEPDTDSASASFLVSAKNYNFKEVELTVTANITITIDQASNFNLIKLGSGTVTFVSGAGRTLIQMNEASEMLSEYSIARVFSIGTNDILYINDNNNLSFVKKENTRYVVALAASFAVVGSNIEANVTISPAFADTNYDVKPNFVEQTAFYHLENKTASGFTLVIHQTTALTQNVPIGIQRYES